MVKDLNKRVFEGERDSTRTDCQIIFINTYYYSVTTFTYNLEDNQETQAGIKFLHGFNRQIQMSSMPKLPNAKKMAEFPLWHHIWWSKPTICSEAYWSHWTSFTIQRILVCLHGRNAYFIFIPAFLFTKFLRASFSDLNHSFICYTNIISNQNMYFSVKKVCKSFWLFTDLISVPISEVAGLIEW